MRIIDKLLEQRNKLVINFTEINALCGASEHPYGARNALYAIRDFDKNYGDIILEEALKELKIKR